MQRPNVILLITLLALAGIASVLLSTTWGIGISPDSVSYIGTARNLLEGRGLVERDDGQLRPVTIFPPLYPTLLAVIGVFGIDPLDAARGLNASLFATNIVLVGLMLYRYSRGSVLIALFGGFLMLTSVDMLEIHAMAWTEALFICLSLVGFLLLAASQTNPRTLLASATACGLASLARYTGIALLATGVIWAYFSSTLSPLRRIRNSIAFLGVATLPLALWLARNLYSTGGATGRNLVLRPISISHLHMVLLTAGTWVLPEAIVTKIGLLGIAGIVGSLSLALVAWRKSAMARVAPSNAATLHPASASSMQEALEGLPGLLGLFIMIYAMFITISIATRAYGSTPLELRILSPIFVSSLIISLCLAHRLVRFAEQGRAVKAVLLASCLALAGLYLVRAATWITAAHREGLGYASRAWKQSETIAKIRDLPHGTHVYSNAPDAIEFLTGTESTFVPSKAASMTYVANENYPAELTAMGKQLRNGKGIFVYFQKVRRNYLPSEREVVDALHLQLLENTTDGSVYAGNP